MIKDAYFAHSTPHQVIGAISIKMGSGLDADLYIFGRFPHYENVAERLEKYKLFQYIILAACKETGVPGRVHGFLQMLFANKTGVTLTCSTLLKWSLQQESFGGNLGWQLLHSEKQGSFYESKAHQLVYSICNIALDEKEVAGWIEQR